MGRNASNHSVSPARGARGGYKSPSRRERSPNARRRGDSPVSSVVQRSPSPRSKRLRRVEADRRPGLDDDDASEAKSSRSSRHDDHHRHSHRRASRSPRRGEEGRAKEGHERNGGGGRGVDRDRERERDGGRRSGRDDPDRGSRRNDSKRGGRSRSPKPRPRDEVPPPRDAERRNDEEDSVSKMQAAEEALKQKEKPSFALSGKLAAETNRVRGVTLLFNEPSDACQPVVRWRLYVFKNGEALNDPLYIHRQSCYLFGRERRVADIPTDHPSCSKQHAVIQFRKVDREKPDGMMEKQIRPYIMDLGSTNKTFINDGPIEPERYYELHEQDTIKFGNSSREYVLLHENSSGS